MPASQVLGRLGWRPISGPATFPFLGPGDNPESCHGRVQNLGPALSRIRPRPYPESGLDRDQNLDPAVSRMWPLSCPDSGPKGWPKHRQGPARRKYSPCWREVGRNRGGSEVESAGEEITPSRTEVESSGNYHPNRATEDSMRLRRLPHCE